MKRALVIAVFVFTGCFNPDDIFPINGRVGGAEQVVMLSRAPNPPMAECGPWSVLERGRSDADGGYTFEVFRAESMRLTNGEPYCFRVNTSYGSGTSVSATVEAIFGEVQVPPMPDWTPGLQLDGGVFAFAPYRTRDPGVDFFVLQHVIEVKAFTRVIWRAADSSLATLGGALPPIPADPRIYEEFGGSATIRASYTEGEGQLSPIGEFVVRPRVEVATRGSLPLGITHVAPSKGAPCDFFSHCPLTDGSLYDESLEGQPWMQVNFKAPLAPSLVVIRGLVVHGPSLDVSGVQFDGGLLPLGTFAVTRELDGPGSLGVNGYVPAPTFVALPVDAGEPVASLRVTAEGLVQVDEVSIY